MSPNRQYIRARGFSLIELMVVLAIIGALMLGYLALKRDDNNTLRNAGIAQQLSLMNAAADSYAKANSASLLASTGPATAVTVTVAQLAAGGGRIDPSFGGTNAYGQTWRVRIYQPSTGDLRSLVDTYGGTPISDDSLVEIAQLAIRNNGTPAGFIASRAPLSGVPAGCSGTDATQYARGAFGDWCVMLSAFGGSPGAGHLASAVFYGNAATTDDALHRTATPGQPQLNRMSTAIDMNGNAISNVSNVRTQAAGQGITFFGGGESVVGSADYGISFLTQNNTERMRLYNDGHLALNSYLSLPGGQSLAMGTSWLYGDNSNMALRPGANGGTVYLQGPGGAGSAHLNVAGQIVAQEIYTNNWFRVQGGGGIYWQQFGKGWNMSDGTWMRCYQDCSVYTGGQVQAGSVVSNGRMTANEYFQINGQAAAGWGCSPNGVEARASDGSPLWCINGVFRGLGGAPRNWSLVANYVNQNYTGHNYTDHDMYVSAVSNGTSCGNLNNDYAAWAIVNGAEVAANVTNNTDSYKRASMGFFVPSGADYQILWTRYKCNTQTVVWEYR